MSKNKKGKKNLNLIDSYKKFFYKILDSILNKTIIEDKYIERIKILKKEICKKAFKKNFKLFSSKFNSFFNTTIIDYKQLLKVKDFIPSFDKKVFKKNFKLFSSKFNSFFRKSTIAKNKKNLRIKSKDINIITNLKKKNIYKFKFKTEEIKKVIKRNKVIFSLSKSFEKFKYHKKLNSAKNISFSNNKSFLFEIKEELKKLTERIAFKKFLKSVKQNKFESKASPEVIVACYYCDHSLFLAKIFRSKNLLNVDLIIELPIPAKVIGDNLITNIEDLIEITLDSFEVLNLSNPPILLILSSSFFNIKSFKNDSLLNEDDEIIKNKSPYLPEDTLVNIDKSKNENNYILRALYTRKAFMNGWIKTLQKLDLPVIGITTPGPHQFDILRSNKKLINDIEIIVDIELSSSTIFICTKTFEINSQKLPYGSSLYNKKDLIDSYFSRLIKSIKLIIKDNKMPFPEVIYVSGFGLDEFDNHSKNLPYPFIRFSELNNLKFSFDDTKSEELINKKFDSKLNLILEIANKCL